MHSMHRVTLNVIKSRQLQWARHMGNMGIEEEKCMQGDWKDSKYICRQIGRDVTYRRPRRRWEDNTK